MLNDHWFLQNDNADDGSIVKNNDVIATATKLSACTMPLGGLNFKVHVNSVASPFTKKITSPFCMTGQRPLEHNSKMRVPCAICVQSPASSKQFWGHCIGTANNCNERASPQYKYDIH